MQTRLVNVTEFKSHCLALLKDIEQHGESITVTRRGKPVAVVAPAKNSVWKSPANSWAGRAEIIGDIVNLDTSDLWDAVNERGSKE